jgi:thiosulfate reductase cytochrome b subunit
MTAAPRARRPQPLLLRLTHWVNVPALAIMAMSGLQILVAYPYLGPRGAAYSWWPFQGWKPPAWMRLGDWLAGARHWHFAFAWVFVGNAAIYLAYLAASGEWRRRTFWPPRDTRPALAQVLHYLRIRKQAPPADLYNGLQRLAYTSALALGAVEVASGLAIYKPVQLHWLAWCFGGYDGARAVHLIALFLLLGFIVGHVIMAALHPRSLAEMITGGKRPASQRGNR